MCDQMNILNIYWQTVDNQSALWFNVNIKIVLNFLQKKPTNGKNVEIFSFYIFWFSLLYIHFLRKVPSITTNNRCVITCGMFIDHHMVTYVQGDSLDINYRHVMNQNHPPHGNHCTSWLCVTRVPIDPTDVPPKCVSASGCFICLLFHTRRCSS